MNSTPLSPTPAQAGPTTDISLVNLAARQRMLSQRVILQTLLAAQGDASRLDDAGRSLRIFTESQTQLLATPRQLDPPSAQRIERTYHGTHGVGGIIDAFVNLVRTALEHVTHRDSRQAESIAALVGHTDKVLEALNIATTAFDEITRAKSESIMRELSGIVSDIQSVAREAKVVSFNAQVMAARAGQHGREFAVVANVLSGITGEIDGLSRKAIVLANRSKVAV